MKSRNAKGAPPLFSTRRSWIRLAALASMNNTLPVARPFWQASPDRKMERVRGIEPPYSAWEADVLPLNYTRVARRRRMIRGLP